jgi:hypothetical protein
MKNITFKSLLPHLIALLIFIIITFIFFQPMIMDGRVMIQNDVIQGRGGGQELKEFREETGQEGLWTNSMFGGMPGYLISVYWSGDLAQHIQKVISLGFPSPAMYLFLSMLCFYIMLLTFKINPYLSIIGAIAFGLNSFNILSIEAGHIWKISAITYMPLVIAGVQLLFSKKYWLGIGLTALAVALELRSNHFQITYYLFLILLIMWLVHLYAAFKNGELNDFIKTTGIIAIAGILGLATSLGKIWTSLEYSPYSIRGKSELSTNTQSTSGGLDRDYAFAWSNGIAESMTFMVPYFYGGASGENVGVESSLGENLRARGIPVGQVRQFVSQAPTYWGNQPFTGGPYYIGIIVVFLFVLGIYSVKGPLKYWLIIAIALGFVLSWGKNLSWFNYFMFDYFPLYNKFRAVSMTLIIPFVCMPLLGMLGLNEFIKSPNRSFLIKSAIITSGILLLVLIASYFMSFSSPKDSAMQQDWLIQAIEDQRASMLRSSALKSLLFGLLAVLVLYLYELKKLNIYLLTGVLSLLILIDLVTLDRKYLNDENFKRQSTVTIGQPDDADKEILRDSAQFRVLNLTANIFNDAVTSFHHSSIGGYHGAKMRRYADVIDRYLQDEIQKLYTRFSNNLTNLEGIPILNMLNTKYIKIGSTSNAEVRNSGAMGNAWFVNSVKKVNSADEEIEAIGTEILRLTAISQWEPEKSVYSIGSISLTEYQPNYLKYESKNNGDGFAVFSEIYYPKGWSAYVDGEEVPIRQVNYLLRGLEIPAGEHVVEFRFRPYSYHIGNTIMLISSILVILIFLFSIFQELKSRNA